MDYEKYNNALEKAKVRYNEIKDTNCSEEKFLLDIFPELKESEDEKIRKALIELFTATSKKDWRDIPTEKIIAWLEKQGNHLENYDEAEKEKAGFVGDGFIECQADFLDFKEGNTYWLEYIGNDKYNVRSDNLLGKTYHITPCQLYTIFKKQTWLEKQAPVEHFELKKGHWYMCHRAYCCRADHLTVKEGEKFQCEKDGIVKGFVIKEPEKYFIEVYASAPMEDNQNDEVRRRSTIQVLEYARSLDAYNQYGKADIDKNIAWLEKQGEQDFSHNVDDEIRNELYDFIYITTFQPKDLKKKERFLDWIEKQGNNSNQTWKPSKEQINALEHFVRSIGESGYASPYDDNTNRIKSLLNDLCKLKKQGEKKVSSVDFKAKDWYVSEVDGKIHDMTYNPADKVEPKFKKE